MSEFADLFEDGYIEPKAEEKAALIAELQSGNYKLSFSSLSAFAVSPRAFIAYKLQEEWLRANFILNNLSTKFDSIVNSSIDGTNQKNWKQQPGAYRDWETDRKSVV